MKLRYYVIFGILMVLLFCTVYAVNSARLDAKIESLSYNEDLVEDGVKINGIEVDYAGKTYDYKELPQVVTSAGIVTCVVDYDGTGKVKKDALLVYSTDEKTDVSYEDGDYIKITLPKKEEGK